MSHAAWAKGLKENLFSSGSVFDLVGEEDRGAAEWDRFADSWSRLPVDAFMANGETYRLRRHSVFNVHAIDGIDELAPRPYVQALDINHLNGDVLRTYEPFESAITGSNLFRRLLAGLTAVLTELHGPDVWHHQCFQNRITTSSEQNGNPTPEGVHRDGVDYVVTLLVGRDGISGGRSGLYDAVTRRQIHSQTLTSPGDMLIADDEQTLHDATPITPVAQGHSGHRDVFIDVITRGTTPRCPVPPVTA